MYAQVRSLGLLRYIYGLYPPSKPRIAHFRLLEN